nr:callose synthase 3-like [Ipomoea batatas]
MSSRGGAEPSLQRRLTRTQTVGNIGESIFDSEVVPSSLVEIAPILRVANEVEPSNPRVAYLFRPLHGGDKLEFDGLRWRTPSPSKKTSEVETGSSPPCLFHGGDELEFDGGDEPMEKTFEEDFVSSDGD